MEEKKESKAGIFSLVAVGAVLLTAAVTTIILMVQSYELKAVREKWKEYDDCGI